MANLGNFSKANSYMGMPIDVDDLYRLHNGSAIDRDRHAEYLRQRAMAALCGRHAPKIGPPVA